MLTLHRSFPLTAHRSMSAGPEGRLAVHQTATIFQLWEFKPCFFRFLLDKEICELGYVLDTGPVALDMRCQLDISI